MTHHIMCLILVACSFFPQEKAYKKTVIETSSNSIYKVQSSGFYYEEWGSPLEITLIRNNSDTLWSKSLNSDLPCVSNTGTVATTEGSKMIFYNDIGDKIWEFSFEGRFCYFLNEDNSNVVDAFSDDGNCYYFVFEDEKHEISISKILLFKGEVFKQNIQNTIPCSLRPYKDKLIVHEFCFGMKNFTNKAYVLDNEGKIISEIQYDLTSPNHFKEIYFDTNKDTVYFYFKNRENVETTKALYLGN